jgi:hypothetical protein
MARYETIELKELPVIAPCDHFKILYDGITRGFGCELTGGKCPFDNKVGFQRHPEFQFHCRNYYVKTEPLKED